MLCEPATLVLVLWLSANDVLKLCDPDMLVLSLALALLINDSLLLRNSLSLTLSDSLLCIEVLVLSDALF